VKEISRFPSPVGELGWHALANNRDHRFDDPADLRADYDFVVVGAGFAGVSAASRLVELRPGASIALVDALPVGMGDSGRNAGFLVDIPHATVGDPEQGLEHHKWRFRLNKIVIDRMRKIKEDNKLQVDWLECGKHLAAREAKCLSSLDHLAKILDAIGLPSEYVDREELGMTLGTDYYIKSLYTPGTILINPSEVVRALTMVLPKTVQVFERLPVLRVVEGATPAVEFTSGKTVRASKVILTVSAFLNGFGVKASGRMFGVNSFGAFTRELTADELLSFQKVAPWGCTSAHPAGTTVRFTSARRIYVRNGLTFSPNQYTSPECVHGARWKLRKAFEARFPKLAHLNFEFVYGGMIPLTLNTKSLFGPVAQNVYAGTVGDGLGLTRSSMLGLFLADMVCGVDSEELRYLERTSGPSWCPPEPFRSIAANARLAFDEMRAGGEV
jgi:glycine/D-amino acid oxidase-like deaminating enzyme